jgi:hypothetical protein
MLSETSENLHNLRGSFIRSEVPIAHHTFLSLFSNFSFVLSTFLSGSFSSFPHSFLLSYFLSLLFDPVLYTVRNVVKHVIAYKNESCVTIETGILSQNISVHKRYSLNSLQSSDNYTYLFFSVKLEDISPKMCWPIYEFAWSS